MPLYTTQGIFVYRGTEVNKQHIVHCCGSKAEHHNVESSWHHQLIITKMMIATTWAKNRLVILYFGRRGTQSYVYSTMVSSFSCLLLSFIKPWKRKNGTIIYFNQSAQKISVGFLTIVRNSFQILLQRFVDMVLERRNSEQKKIMKGSKQKWKRKGKD